MMGQAPTIDQIERHARAVLRQLPEPFAGHLRDIVLIVEEFADEATLAEMEIDDPFALTGLYHGTPVGEKPGAIGALPDRIHLYRRPILDEWCDTGERLDHLIAHVVIHEVGHHFGLSDAAMHALEQAAGGAA
ncbi:MAG: metallopeptidase family protein [Sphingomonas sp.]|uniref:metallopeptidase family protein n=1 Tax=Sphingomonas sp. TaxID=28214 RepID=UPI00184DD066|nr:neutral zinc metallopeptidase [Zymomonas sp.]MBA4772405.1 metallopeptidase family protein [Sphingomonas sp.]